MGDRGNIIIEKDSECFPSPVFFYTHWNGSVMKKNLQKALIKGRSRWDDPSYLARVIFQVLLDGDDGVTGYGISTSVGDNEHPYLCVHMESKQVFERKDDDGKVEGVILGQWSFDEFSKLDL